MKLYIYDLVRYIPLYVPQNHKWEYHIQKLKRYKELVVKPLFLYVHIEEPFGFKIVSHFLEISFSSRFIAFFVCTFFFLFLSLKGNEKGFTKNLEKVRHDFVDTSFVKTFTKKSTDLRENLVPFYILKVMRFQRFLDLVKIKDFI